MNRRVVTAGVGIVLALVAGGFLVRPALVGRLEPVLAAVDNTYLLLAGVAAIATVQALREFLRGASVGVEYGHAPAVESFAPATTPGTELDDAVHELCHTRGVRQTRDRDRIRERLRRDAIGTLATAGGYGRREAETAVEEGTWTDDRFAAGFVGGDQAPGPRLHQRFIARYSRTPRFERAVVRTIDAIEAVERER